MEFFHKQTNFPFMATRRIWYARWVVLMIASIISFATRGLNLAIEFTGGVSVQSTFPGVAPLDKIRSALEQGGFHEPVVQNFGSSHEVQIRLAAEAGQTEQTIRPKVTQILTTLDPGATIDDLFVVGPQVGAELRKSAIWALSITLVAVFIYIVLRFHTWRLSTGALLALLHDPVLVLGVFSISGTPFDLAVVAAILAVVGYSLNDTIIVFDRIRERFEANRRLPSAMVLDQSINQTLSRTIMTKVTTSIVVVALLFLGGPVLRGFAEALIIGIVAGTYSSIYISSSIALDLGLKAEHVFPTASRREADSLP
jgi:preprotein translocase subunit SecF